MVEMRYDVLLDDEIIGKDMEIDDALIFVKSLSQAYRNQMVTIGSRVSVRVNEECVKKLNTEEE